MMFWIFMIVLVAVTPAIIRSLKGGEKNNEDNLDNQK